MVDEIEIGEPSPENEIPVLAQQLLKVERVAHDRRQFVEPGR